MLVFKVFYFNLDIIIVEEVKLKNIFFDESKIVEVEELFNLFRRYGVIKKVLVRVFNNNRRKINLYFENFDLSFEGFDKDILVFRE